MQPLNTIVKPSVESVIGCLANGDGSMIASRRWPRATEPDDQTPQSSGPRGVSASVIRATAATSAVASSKRISPAMPHMTERSGDHAQLVEGRIVRALEKHALADTLASGGREVMRMLLHAGRPPPVSRARRTVERAAARSSV